MLNILPRPAKIESDIWVDEAIWGHRLYDEQTPWLTILEFLGIVQSETLANRAFIEEKVNDLRYTTYSRLYLRNILFNNPSLEAILVEFSDDETRWKVWIEQMNQDSGGLSNSDFSYLKSRFASFKDFVAIIKFLQGSAIEGDSNKRWSSKFVFPYGPNCLYEDLRIKDTSASNDRRFFGRTGELLYLMLSRSSKGPEILFYLQKLGLIVDTKSQIKRSKWDYLVATLQPQSDIDKTKPSGSPPYLPLENLPEYDAMANDWLGVLQCDMPDYDCLPHLVTIVGVHLIIYLLNRAKEVLEQPPQPNFILEIVSPKKTVIRDLAASSFLQNNNLPQQAVEFYIKKSLVDAEWKTCETSSDPIGDAIKFLNIKFGWPNDDHDMEGAGAPNKLVETLCSKAITRHASHLGKFHRTWAREIGLSSSRGSKRIRYVPTDSLLRTLVLCTVPFRMEFQDFLTELYNKYGFIIGDKQAADIIASGGADQEAFAANAYRLEQRLVSIGLLKRLSDACAYVQNPFALEVSQ